MHPAHEDTEDSGNSGIHDLSLSLWEHQKGFVMDQESVQTDVLVPVEEYLSTGYSPDVDYVDGRLVERNVGEYYHSLLQGLVVTYFNSTLRARYGRKFRAFPE